MDSPSSPAYNLNNPAVKRIMQELKEIQKENSYLYTARPLEDNIFEWHFTIRGPRDTPFEGGIYHGRIILPSEYPFKPPSIVLLTANGRFEVGQKICLSISERHPEHWQPSWSIRTALVALIAFMPTKGEGAIGAIDYSPEERKALAIKSKTWKCEKCNSDNATCLPPEPEIPTTPLRDSSNNVNNNTNIRVSAISFSLEPATPNSPKPPTEVSTPLTSSNPSPTRQMTPQQLALLRKREELKQRLSRVTNDNEPAPAETPQTPATPAPVQNPPPNAEVQPQPTPVVQNQPTTLTLTPDQLRRERILDITITLVLFVLIGLLVRKLFSEKSLDDL